MRRMIGAVLVLLGTLVQTAGCDVSLTGGGPFTWESDDYPGLWNRDTLEAVIDFPAAWVEVLANNVDSSWGRMSVGDTLRLAVVRWTTVGPYPCTSPDTVRSVVWGITAWGNGGQTGDTASARVVTAGDGTAVVIARKPGAFGVVYTAASDTYGPRYFATTWANHIVVCGLKPEWNGWYDVGMIHVVADSTLNPG